MRAQHDGSTTRSQFITQAFQALRPLADKALSILKEYILSKYPDAVCNIDSEDIRISDMATHQAIGHLITYETDDFELRSRICDAMLLVSTFEYFEFVSQLETRRYSHGY